MSCLYIFEIHTELLMSEITFLKFFFGIIKQKEICWEGFSQKLINVKINRRVYLKLWSYFLYNFMFAVFQKLRNDGWLYTFTIWSLHNDLSRSVCIWLYPHIFFTLCKILFIALKFYFPTNRFYTTLIDLQLNCHFLWKQFRTKK